MSKRKIAGKGYTKLRIFVSSPGDVHQERECLKQVIEELNRTTADEKGIMLELLDWATHVAPYMGRPQQVILDQLPVDTWDIFIGILWARFGTPPGAINPVTGQSYMGGTEEEFNLAYQAWLKHKRPQVMFYRCSRSLPSLDEIDTDQLGRVKRFFEQFSPTGSHPGLYKKYKDVIDFERSIRSDLINLLFDYRKEQVLSDKRPELLEPTDILKSPQLTGSGDEADETQPDVDDNWNMATIRKMVTAALSDEDLNALCFDHFTSVYEESGSGMSKTEKIQRLLDYCNRHDRIGELIKHVKEYNPSQYARFSSKLRK